MMNWKERLSKEASLSDKENAFKRLWLELTAASWEKRSDPREVQGAQLALYEHWKDCIDTGETAKASPETLRFRRYRSFLTRLRLT